MSNGASTWTNTYNADGLRTKRTNGTSTYSYVYNGSSLVQMTVDGNTLYFTYDASGTPQTVTYNGTTYYYATNLQGDITAILDSTGTTVVSYTYDAWGNHTSGSNGTGTLASTLGRHNPLRYRGYVYDTETGLYYLQSRYYSPELGRFLNADGLAATGQGVLGNNMFAYCGNNPICRSDRSGRAWSVIALVVAIALLLSGCDNSGETEHSPEELAAFEAGKQVRQKANATNNEYICGVYKLDSGDYVVGNCFEGGHDNASIEPVMREASSYSDRTLVAFVHSHPYCTGHVPNDFSRYTFDDKTKKLKTIGDLAVAAQTQLPVYLAAPNGNLYVLHATDYILVGDSYVWDYNSRYVMGGLQKDETAFDCSK